MFPGDQTAHAILILREPRFSGATPVANGPRHSEHAGSKGIILVPEACRIPNVRRELIASLPVLIGFAIAQSGPQNLGFEHGQPGASPQGWVVPTPGYAAKLTAEKPKAGVLCAELVRSGESGQGRFGNLMQSFDATAYRGKRVRFRAAVRINTVVKGNRGDRAQLWLRVDRQNGQMGFFDNMDDRPIREPEWNYFEITGDVATDAERINIGMIVFGSGKAWIDDVSFEALGNVPTVPVEAARGLTPRGLEDEIAFARLFGYVRYFHPSDQAMHTDWTSFAIRGAREVESARDDTELAQKLTSLFSPIAPTVRALTTVQEYALPADLLPPKGAADLKVTYWRHLGDGLTSQKPNAYHSERVEESAQGAGRISIDFLTSLGFRSKTLAPDSPWNADVGGGVRVWVAVALYADSQGTLPHAPIVPDPPNGVKPVWSASDRGTRLGDVIIAWNVFQHFYPYFDVVNTDWSSELRKALASAATDKNEAAFTDTLRRLVAALHDGHGQVVKTSQHATLPLTWDWIEGKLVITAVAPSASGRISAGDAVLKIDGRDAGEALAAQEDLISGATPQWIRYRALGELAGGNNGENINLEIEPFSAPGKTTGILLQYEPANRRRNAVLPRWRKSNHTSITSMCRACRPQTSSQRSRNSR